MQFPIKKRGGKKLLEERKKRVLQAIVEEYIKTAEPVSSGAIMNLEGLEYSSATIRNEMAELEKMGYIEKTHTSSGRVPSAKGYRYYVDELLEDNKITVDEIDYISKKLETKVNELEEITQIASSTISEITHYTTVTIGPNTDEQKIENIKFVLLSPRMMMAVILTDNGLVKETIIKFDEDITDKQVETINYMFNQKLKGQPLQIIDVPLEEYLINEMKYSVNLIKPIIEQMKKVVEEGEYEIQIGTASDDIRLRRTIFVGRQPVTSNSLGHNDFCMDEIVKNPERKIKVAGCVRDVQATPISGIEIKSNYSGRTVISKEGGRYSILTVENDVLTVSAKGFETVNIKVNKQKDIDIKLNYSHD